MSVHPTPAATAAREPRVEQAAWPPTNDQPWPCVPTGAAGQQALFKLEEFPELWADACLRNSEGRLMFLSFYGRDTSVLQFIAALELGAQHDKGVDRFHLVDGQGQRHAVDVMGAQRLDKHAARLPRNGLFGPLSHLWLFDKALRQPDRANGIAWVMHHCGHRLGPQAPQAGTGVGHQAGPTNDAARDDLVWRTLVDLSPVAVLPHWRTPVLAWCRKRLAIAPLDDRAYPALGPVQAIRISLSANFLAFISQAVHDGTLSPQP